MYYNYFRDYDPAIGRYIESDPIGLKGGPNTFSYVDSSPLVWLDPKGLAKGGRGGLPGTDDCKESERRQCDAKCAPRAVKGCYVTISWKFRGLRGGNPIRSEERNVECNCDDEPICDKGCQAGLLIAGLCMVCALQPELCIPAGLGLGLGW